MLAARSTVRLAAKAPTVAAPRPAGPSRRTVAMASGQNMPDLNAMKDAALGAAKQAAEKVKDLDMQKVKGAVQGGVENVKQSIDTALESWGKYDSNGDGKLTISEVVDLLNSPELTGAVEKMTGQPHTKRTIEDIKKWFGRADFNKDELMSKREFAVLYAGLQADKAKAGVTGMATNIMAALDRDGNGTIGSTEFKKMLENSPLSMLAKFVPEGKEVNYRDILGKAK